jgi:hypothetical protein
VKNWQRGWKDVLLLEKQHEPACLRFLIANRTTTLQDTEELLTINNMRFAGQKYPRLQVAGAMGRIILGTHHNRLVL